MLKSVGDTCAFYFALINICMVTMDQMALCNVRGLGSDKLKRDDHQTLQFPSALRSIGASFSSVFWFTARNFYCLNSVSELSSTVFSVFSNNTKKKKNYQLYNYYCDYTPLHQSCNLVLLSLWINLSIIFFINGLIKLFGLYNC